ncbi:MAG: hypothetical protein Hyperionvirus27_32, partial [Hyperionvirus sp.]
ELALPWMRVLRSRIFRSMSNVLSFSTKSGNGTFCQKKILNGIMIFDSWGGSIFCVEGMVVYIYHIVYVAGFAGE